MSRKVVLELPASKISDILSFLNPSEMITLNFVMPQEKKKELEILAKSSNWNLKIFHPENTNSNSNDSSFISDLNSNNVYSKNESAISEKKKKIECSYSINDEFNKVCSKNLNKLDPLKKFYLEKKKKLEDFEDSYRNEKMKIIFEEDNSITIKSEDHKCLIQVEQQIRKIIKKLSYSICEKVFNKESEIFDFVNLDWMKDMMEEHGFTSLMIRNEESKGFDEELKKRIKKYPLVWFMDDGSEREEEFMTVCKTIMEWQDQIINMKEIMENNYIFEERRNYNFLNRMKFKYLNSYLIQEMMDLAEEKKIKLDKNCLQSLNKNDYILKFQCDLQTILIFKGSVLSFSKNLYASTISISKKTNYKLYKDVIEKKVLLLKENFEKSNTKLNGKKMNILIECNYSSQDSNFDISFAVYCHEEEFKQIHKSFVDICNYENVQKEIVDFPNIKENFYKIDFIKELKDRYQIEINVINQKLILFGNADNISKLVNYLQELDKKNVRKTIICEFENYLLFDLFKKYSSSQFLKKIETNFKSQSISFNLSRENKKLEISCITEYDKQIEDKFKSEYSDLKSQIIIMKNHQIKNKDKFQLLLEKDFITKIICPETENFLPIEIITTKSKVEEVVSNSNKASKNSYTFENRINFNVIDSANPLTYESEIDGLVINFDVKGNSLDNYSEEIAKKSNTKSFFARNINVLNDPSFNKKKKATVQSVMEFRTDGNIKKIFYSIIENKKLRDYNSNYNSQNYNYKINLSNKKGALTIEEDKFNYYSNLEIILKTVIDVKIQNLGVIIPDNNESRTLINYFKEFCSKNKLILTELKSIYIFTNTNEEATYFKNEFQKSFPQQNEKENDENNDIEKKNEEFSQNEWRYVNENEREFYFNETESNFLTDCCNKNCMETFLIQKENPDKLHTEIIIDVQNGEATELCEYKKINLKQLLQSDLLLAEVYKYYKEAKIEKLRYYLNNSIYLFLDLKNMKMIRRNLMNDNEINCELIKKEIKIIQDLENFGENEELVYAIRGLESDIKEGFNRITLELEKEKKEEVIEVPENLERKKIDLILQKVRGENVECEITFENNNLIKLFGFEKDVLVAANQINKEMTKEISHFKNIAYPKEWEEQKDNVQTFSVSSNSEEFKEIERVFQNSVKNAKIKRIKRVQNLFLYNLYHYQKEHIIKKGSPTNERMLFHGTRSIDPKEIYDSIDVGFDMRLANKGMWGEAIYFAVNACYSHVYSFLKAYKPKNMRVRNSKQTKKMIYASVLIGESVKMENNQEIKRPPIKNAKTKELYDSIQGFTQNNEIYIIYDNSRAYPSYIITYEE